MYKNMQYDRCLTNVYKQNLDQYVEYFHHPGNFLMRLFCQSTLRDVTIALFSITIDEYCMSLTLYN